MENQSDTKTGFWSRFFKPDCNTVGQSDQSARTRYAITDMITENIELKKKLKDTQIQLSESQKRASSYAVVIEDLNEQIKEYKERFQ